MKEKFPNYSGCKMQKGGEHVEASAEKRKTRNSSKSERRNSVSDIKDFFTSKMASNVRTKPNANSTPPVKTKEKTKKTESTKDKENTPQTKEKEWADRVEENLKEGEKTSNTACDNHDDQLEASENSQPLTIKATKETQTMDDVILKELKAIKEKIASLDKDINDPKNGISNILAKTTQRVDGVYSDIHGAVDGLKTKMLKVQKDSASMEDRITKMETNYDRMSKLLDENKRLVDELQLMQGLVQKVNKQTNVASMQIMDLTKRGMEQNLIIQGIDDEIEVQDSKAEKPMFTAKERCKQAALDFFQKHMNIDLEASDIWKAHRTGLRKPGKVRPMIVKLAYPAKDLVMENIASLKGKKNIKTNQTFFISEQIPEGVMETKKRNAERLKTLKEANDKKETKDKIQVINDKILVNDELDSMEITTPQPSELFVDPTTQKAINTLQEKMHETEVFTIRNSQFVGVAVKAHSVQEVRDAYVGVMQRYPASDHTIMAYALKEKGKLKQGGCDDREYGASTRIKKLIFEAKAKNVAIFVLRSFGGVHLGFDRFKAIEKVAQEAIQLQLSATT